MWLSQQKLGGVRTKLSRIDSTARTHVADDVGEHLFQVSFGQGPHDEIGFSAHHLSGFEEAAVRVLPTERTKKTILGYRTFSCSDCRRTFNERTGTPFNYLEYPTDLVLLVIFWRLRYKLSLRDLAEMFLQRGFVFTHETVRGNLLK